MNQQEMRAISQLVADLNTSVHNEVRMLHDRVTIAEQRIEAWEKWGEQVNGAIDELAGRIGAVQTYVVEQVTSGAYESEVTDMYRRFVAGEAARVGVELKELQGEIKARRGEQIRATMDPVLQDNQ